MSNNPNKHENIELTNCSSKDDILYYSSSKFNSYANLIVEDGLSSSIVNPVVVNDNDPDDDESNVSLIYKQPSYLSLSDIVITKGGDIIYNSNSILNTNNQDVINEELNINNIKDDLPEIDSKRHNLFNDQNPVIVFDSVKCISSPDELEDSPIQLSVRQPSYISLGPLEVIPKGSSSLSDFHPKIKKSIPNRNDFIDNDEEKNPEIQFIQKLNRTNSRRWNKIGYKPPENLIPLVRAASLHDMEIVNTSCTFKLENHSKNYSQNNLFNNNNIINPRLSYLEPIVEENENFKININCGKIRRSSSFGMEIGEAENKSVEMMNEIFGSSSHLFENHVEGDDFADDEL